MANLVSPGVSVSVIDESFYTPAAAGTIPMIFVASAANKQNGSGSGIAPGTLSANAGKPYLITSQRELVETFGDPKFYSDANNNMIHGGELNEYGLQTAYSLLGVTNRAYVVRADLDLGKLTAQSDAPGGDPADGTYWFDTQVTEFGIQEWNGAAVTTTGGQSFTTQTPLVITDETQLVGNSVTGDPKDSVGAIGDYAVVATTTANKVYYKNQDGVWVGAGSAAWKASWATVRGTVQNPTLTPSGEVIIDGTTVLFGATPTLDTVSSAINGAGITGVSAAEVDNAIEIYTSNDSMTLAGTNISELGLTAGTFYAPTVSIDPHTRVPAYKSTDTNPRPTGSIWLKTTEPNGGARFRVKIWNDTTGLWEAVEAPMYKTNEGAIFNLDKSGGGQNLVTGDLYVKANIEEDASALGSFKLYRRVTGGATRIISPKVATQLTAASNIQFDIQETKVNRETLADAISVTFTATGASGDADAMAGAINGAGFTNIVASVDAQNRVVIEHKLGGDFRIADTNGSLTELGFAVFDEDDPTTTANLYAVPTADTTNDFLVSNWKVLSYTASDDAPQALATDGELWYNSVIDEVDLMIHDGNNWVGYQNYSTDFQDTDPNGPQVRATQPTTQSDGTPLVDGDLWIDTADIENYPMIYQFSAALGKFVLKDKADQTTENGVLFADARYNTSGANSDEAGDIDILLASDYLDPDAPDPALYPKGMLLWNLRRSGFNVKRFERNYIDTASDNERNGDESMDAYYPHRWVTESANQVDGSGSFGRHAQRKSVVQALQAMLNSNQEIRDEDSRQFNIMATPGYPELIGEMISLNVDRRLTAFVVGDTPARLTPDATSLNEWATNVRNAVEDNDNGAVSFDEYLGMYYPWGFTSDNEGNNVVVPPSHMALRTIVLNDQVAYPWFAPAGTRRGGVSNATSSGYISSEGEFVSVALNTGQRDTLYSNNINPITFISGAGLIVFGQKTRARNASALDRVNVARLVVYMRTQLEKLARPYLFEPNDKITRDQIKAAADAFMLELVSLRGIYDFLVVCDESNNTPARIDRNELYLDVAIEPVKAIEFIYIPLRLKNTGEIAALG